MTYAMFDGLFQQALLEHFAGVETATADLHASTLALIVRLVPWPTHDHQPGARTA
jgi:hypothetical protein